MDDDVGNRSVFDNTNNLRITSQSRDVTKFKSSEWDSISRMKL